MADILDTLRMQAINACKERMKRGEKISLPPTLPRMKSKHGL